MVWLLVAFPVVWSLASLAWHHLLSIHYLCILSGLGVIARVLIDTWMRASTVDVEAPWPDVAARIGFMTMAGAAAGVWLVVIPLVGGYAVTGAVWG